MPKLLIIFILLFTLAGCATLPKKESLPTYNIGGRSYVALISLCESRSIKWDYDTFTRTVVLNKGAHRINLMVDDNQALVDGSPEYLKYPPTLYEGRLMVPAKFKEEIMDTLFKESAPGLKAKAVSSIKKIVIDAGHGGTDPGTIGRSGIREKIVDLDIAMRLSNLLKDNGFNVVMVRSADVFVPLERRAEIANNSGADIFISIHANANRVRSLKGFEVYYISADMEADSRRAKEAAVNLPAGLGSFCYANPSSDLKATLWDMVYTANRAESFNLARSLCRAADNNLNLKALRIKGANFYVLKGVQMPAVLVEVGYLSNTEEENKLRNSYYRQQLAEVIKEGIENYK